MYDDFKTANYPFSLVSPEMTARHLVHLFSGDVIDGLTLSPGTGLEVVLAPGNALVRYGSGATSSARLVTLTANFPLAIDPSDASNPRIDSVVLYIDNDVDLPVVDASNPPTSANQDGPGVAKAIIVKGTPNANPIAPSAAQIQAAISSSNPYTVLHNVRRNVGASVVSTADITNVGAKAFPTALLSSTEVLTSLFTAFGASVVSSSNPGTAGGTRNCINIGGWLVQWGRTNSITNGANTEIQRGVIFQVPFDATPTCIASIHQASGSVASNILIGASLSATAVSWFWRNNTSGGTIGGPASWIAIGKAAS